MRYAVRPRRAKCAMTNGRGTISRRANRFLCGENFARDCARDVRELRYTCADDRARATARENRLRYISVQECCSAVLLLFPNSTFPRDTRALRRHWTRGLSGWAFGYSISKVATCRYHFKVTRENVAIRAFLPQHSCARPHRLGNGN